MNDIITSFLVRHNVTNVPIGAQFQSYSLLIDNNKTKSD